MHVFPQATALRLSLSLAVALVAFASARAQSPLPGSPMLSGADQQAILAQQARQGVTDRILSAGGVPLEGAIDPSEYIVGPGDVFSITIGGAIPQQFAPTVSADGVLVIPSVGSFRVAGLNLAEARVQTGAALRQAFRNVPTEVALSQPRQFYVHVSGEVTRPGRHVAVPVARVEDALAAAMEGNNPLQALELRQRETDEPDGLPALRNVTVVRQNGERFVVDLLHYYATGDTENNPYLRDGDRLYVPTFTKDGNALFVERQSRTTPGDMSDVGERRANAAFYDFRPGDMLTDLLLVAGGPELLAQTDAVRLLRNTTGPLDVRDVDVRAIRTGTASDVTLQPRDRLLLPEVVPQAGTAEIEGLVEYPGTYPIVVGQTTLQDLVEAAGGVLPDGLLRAAYLERRGPAESTNQPSSSPDALESPQDRLDSLEREVFRQARLSDLSFGSRQYLARELLEYQRVSLSLSDEPSSIPSVPLRDGDRFVVPRDPDAVLVVGQVRAPGYVPYQAGADAAFYLSQAGGLGPAAADVYLREAGSGTLRSPENAAIRSGDALFVDRILIADTESQQALTLQERQIAYQRQDAAASRRIQYLQAGIAVLGTAVGVITTYLFTRDSN